MIILKFSMLAKRFPKMRFVKFIVRAQPIALHSEKRKDGISVAVRSLLVIGIALASVRII